MVSFLIPMFAVCAYPEELVSSLPATQSLQAVVVTTKGWESPSATLQRYGRNHPDEPWRAAGDSIPVVVGRKGLGWGTGLHSKVGSNEPIKKEGDGKAPAGIFRLSAAFGYAQPEAMSWVRLPYRQATSNLLCIDDTSSACYNKIVDKGQIKTDWNSHEDMHRKDDQYRLGIVVDHNADPVVPGDGSCIFIHIWAKPGAGTAGCTAMAGNHMEAILRWLDPKAKPVLIQLSEEAYIRYRSEWKLPY